MPGRIGASVSRPPCRRRERPLPACPRDRPTARRRRQEVRPSAYTWNTGLPASGRNCTHSSEPIVNFTPSSSDTSCCFRSSTSLRMTAPLTFQGHATTACRTVTSGRAATNSDSVTAATDTISSAKMKLMSPSGAGRKAGSMNLPPAVPAKTVCDRLASANSALSEAFVRMTLPPQPSATSSTRRVMWIGTARFPGPCISQACLSRSNSRDTSDTIRPFSSRTVTASPAGSKITPMWACMAHTSRPTLSTRSAAGAPAEPGCLSPSSKMLTEITSRRSASRTLDAIWVLPAPPWSSTTRNPRLRIRSMSQASRRAPR